MATNVAATGNHVLWKRRLLSHQRIEWIDDLAESSQPAKNIWDFVTTERDMWHCDIMWPWNLEMYPAKMGISTGEMGHVSTWYRQLWPPQKLPNGTWRIMMDLVCSPKRSRKTMDGQQYNQWRHILRLQRRHSTWLMSRLAKFSEQKFCEQWWKLVGYGENNRKHVPKKI
jgi:hypothetical protein